MRDSFIFYRSFYDAINQLPTEHHAALYGAIFRFSLDGNEPTLTGIEAAMWALIKPQLQANQRKFENGSKGGRPRKPNQTETKLKPNNNLSETKPKPNVNDNVNVNDNNNENNNDNEKTQKRFVQPTISEVKQYCLERENKVDAERFIDHYTSNGWYVGKSKMKDWKAAVRTWEKTSIDKPAEPGVRYNYLGMRMSEVPV